MKVLIVSGAARLASQPVLDYATELGQQGVAVSLATWAAPTAALRDALEDVVVWGPLKVAPEAPVPAAAEPAEPDAVAPAVPGSGAGRWRAAYEWRALRLRKKLRPYKRKVTRVTGRLARTGQADRAWLRLRRDGRVMALARQADVVVALDQLAVLAVWKLGRLLPEPELVYGLPASRNVVSRVSQPA